MMLNKKIAITGGIGSGKSTVCQIIKEQGYNVLSCDEIYAELLDRGIFNKVFFENFGDVFDLNGRVDRKKLSKIVFENQEKLQRLNDITHPVVMQELAKRTKDFCLVFVEVQLLFESNLQDYFDNVIIVKRNLKDRIRSVMERSQLSKEDVLARITSQYNYDDLTSKKYSIIENDGCINELYEKVQNVIELIKEKKL